ncbi:MAG: excinuclease ABC subunit UvrA [Bernardetiaceae bacterium]
MKEPVVAEEQIEIFGAREHNLKDIHLAFPRNQLVVITGISGSGKSSLAFETLYAEGQRRYLESFSAYARSFIGNVQRPDVDKINGLSPVISIEQKTTSRNPRSTVGTVTEIYDFMRLLFARAGEAYSYNTGEKMIQQSEAQIIEQILAQFDNQKVSLLAPLVRARKGHYRELFVRYRKLGYTKMRTDGVIIDLQPKMQLDRYKTHDIELVVDRIQVKEQYRTRLFTSIRTALKEGKGVMLLQVEGEEKPRFFSRNLMCPTTGLAYDEPAPNLFSFNSPYGMCPDCKGLGQIPEIVRERIIPDRSLSISRGGIAPLGEFRDILIFKKLEAFLKLHKCSLSTPIERLPEPLIEEILYGSQAEIKVRYGNERTDKVQIWHTTFEGIIPHLEQQEEKGKKSVLEDYLTYVKCPTCQGSRLKKESLHFKIADKNIAELAQLDLQSLADWLDGIEERLNDKQVRIATPVLKEIRKRLRFLLNVGLEYLTLDRTMRSLSGGESQRIRLATQIGTQLVGVLYILDEPSIGLHTRDNARLIDALQRLRDLGNTVVVVEHDKDMMLAADYLIDIGPGAGRHGGRIVAHGTPEQVLQQKSLTADFLNGKAQIHIPKERRKGNLKSLSIKDLSGNNLKNISVDFPLGTFICITGVSGSGKSTLIHHTLYPILNQHFFRSHKKPMPYAAIEGLEHLDKVVEVDQSPIGRTPRSNPATYTGLFTDIRSLFAAMPESKVRGYKPGRFSFNVKGGRCEVCEGAGKQTIEMDFLPDVHIECPACRGLRYNRETLEIRFKGKSIADVLNMSVSEAKDFFVNHPKILRKLKTLYDVGLGYITLGQHATTLSGGEAQRVKLATELSKRDTGNTFYILDEPTTGLHFQDIHYLLEVLQRLVDKGNTVLVIEHNLDVIKVADWVIDLGPEGGQQGGQIIAVGTPEQIIHVPESHTGRFLKSELPQN